MTVIAAGTTGQRILQIRDALLVDSQHILKNFLMCMPFLPLSPAGWMRAVMRRFASSSGDSNTVREVLRARERDLEYLEYLDADLEIGLIVGEGGAREKAPSNVSDFSSPMAAISIVAEGVSIRLTWDLMFFGRKTVRLVMSVLASRFVVAVYGHLR